MPNRGQIDGLGAPELDALEDLAPRRARVRRRRGSIRDGAFGTAIARSQERAARRAGRVASADPRTRVPAPAARTRPQIKRSPAWIACSAATAVRRHAHSGRDELGQDRQRRLLGARRAEIEPDRRARSARGPRREPAGDQPLAALRLRAPGAHRADVSRSPASAATAGRVVELRVVGQDRERGRAVDAAELLERVLRPGDDDLVGVGEALRRWRTARAGR